MENVAYVKGLWSSRYSCLHIAFSDIRIKYRRSIFGPAWACSFIIDIDVTYCHTTFC